MRPPKLSDIRPDDDAEEDRSAWPIHAKDVGSIDLDALADLPGAPESTTRATWAAKRRWLEDDDAYAEHDVPVRSSAGTPTANYRPHWIQRLEETEVVKPIRAKQVRGWTRLYAVPELAKKRFRAIMHTVDINDYCGADTIDHERFPTKLTIAESVHDGDWTICLDFSAYYYQLALSAPVGRRMCFRWHRRFYRLLKLAMGQRQAVDIAKAATARLLDFPHQSRRVMAIIDNVSFTGSQEAVIADATTIIQRCPAVGATLNEIDVQTATADDVAKLATQATDWGGVHIDLVAKTTSLTKKIVDKTRESWARRERWEWRHYAAHVGLLFWAWGIIDLPMASFFEVLRFNSEVGKTAMARLDDERRAKGLPDDAMPPNPFWSEGANVWPSVMPVLRRWTELVLRNAPRVVLQPRQPDILLECDASKWGWGCCGLHVPTNTQLVQGAPWSDLMRRRFGVRLGESTLAEPFGVLHSMAYARDRFPDATRFAITNDNTVAVLSHRRGFNSRSLAINESLREREELFPSRTFSVALRHVAGETNIADGVSRGHAASEVEGGPSFAGMLRSRWGETGDADEDNSAKAGSL